MTKGIMSQQDLPPTYSSHGKGRSNKERRIDIKNECICMFPVKKDINPKDEETTWKYEVRGLLHYIIYHQYKTCRASIPVRY